MLDENGIVRARQKLIRREMERRGILLKQVQLDAGWDTPSTVASYFPADENKEPATMSVAALYRLIDKGALPDDLLSLLLPEGHAIIRVPEGVDLDDIAAKFRDFLAAKDQAHHPQSEEGRNISYGEDAVLRTKLALIAGGRA